jgi:hypothetical protein
LNGCLKSRHLRSTTTIILNIQSHACPWFSSHTAFPDLTTWDIYSVCNVCEWVCWGSTNFGIFKWGFM